MLPPTSHHLRPIIRLLQHLQPRSILHVYGKATDSAHLLAQYMRSTKEPPVTIEAMAPSQSTIPSTEHKQFDNMHIGNIAQLVDQSGSYDIILLHQIQHLAKADGLRLLQNSLRQSHKAVIVTLPARRSSPDAAPASHWTESDLQSMAPCLTLTSRNQTLIAIFLKCSLRAPLRIRLKAHARALTTGAKTIVLRQTLRLHSAVHTLRSHLQTQNPPTFSSRQYWERRYQGGGTSGRGSYGQIAQYKAHFVNQFIRRHDIQSAIEFGSGDGNQLSLLEIDRYIGLDVAATAIDNLRRQFAADPTKEFHLYTLHFSPADQGLSAELGLSLDVIFHLTEDHIFQKYMHDLFRSSQRFVIIYSSNFDAPQTALHVRHREFTRTIAQQMPTWTLLEKQANPHQAQTQANFYVYEKSP